MRIVIVTLGAAALIGALGGAASKLDLPDLKPS